MPPTKGPIWIYFEFSESDPNMAHCKLCKNKYNSKSHTPMKTHLKKCHENEYKLLITKHGMKPLKNEKDIVADKPATTENIHKLVMKYLLFENLPFEHIERRGLRQLLKGLAPNYELGNAEFFKKHVNDAYENIKDKMKEEIKKCNYVSLTAYISKDPNSSNNIFIMSCHGLSETLQRFSKVLTCKIIDANTTGDIVAETFNSVSTELNISTKQVHCMIRDESSALKRVTDPVLPIQDLDCIIYIIQTIIRETFLSEENITVFKQKIENVSEPSNILSLLQEIKEALNMNATDWDSTYNKFKTLFSLGANFSIKTGNLTSTLEKKWEDSRDEVIKCFDYAYGVMGDSQALISEVIPIFRLITESLTEHLKLLPEPNVFRAGVLSLKIKFEKTLSSLESNNLYPIATYLDPRYKKYSKHDITQIQNQIVNMANNDDTMNISFPVSSSNVEKVKTRKMDDFDSDMETPSKINKTSDMFKKLLYKTEDPKNHILQKEMFDYVEQQSLDYNENPLEWWEKNRNRFKNLSVFARRFLSPPAGNVVNRQLIEGNGSWELTLKSKIIFIKHNIEMF